ncbi:MAG: SDR family oxidoreductase [Planctomycetota bacterium]|nr:SDR family oxidoreductase [Planctomycetota bacterium]
MGRITTYRDLGCLVTGASSGIGADIARLLAREGARLVLTARREDRLRELADECTELGAIAAWPIVADLDEPGAPEHVATMAENHLGHVDVLINNAGFAVPGLFASTDLERTLSMIRVNVMASVELAHRLLPGMVRRKTGGILNVASMASFQAAPYQSAYAGTKAFLLNWSDGLHQEYKHTGVAITALCPGVTDTEFFDAAGYPKAAGILKWRAECLPVAELGVRALARGRMEAVPGVLNKVLLFIQRLMPRTLVADVSRRLMGGRPTPVRRPR